MTQLHTVGYRAVLWYPNPLGLEEKESTVCAFPR